MNAWPAYTASDELATSYTRSSRTQPPASTHRTDHSRFQSCVRRVCGHIPNPQMIFRDPVFSDRDRRLSVFRWQQCNRRAAAADSVVWQCDGFASHNALRCESAGRSRVRCHAHHSWPLEHFEVRPNGLNASLQAGHWSALGVASSMAGASTEETMVRSVSPRLVVMASNSLFSFGNALYRVSECIPPGNTYRAPDTHNVSQAKAIKALGLPQRLATGLLNITCSLGRLGQARRKELHDILAHRRGVGHCCDTETQRR